jgi:hypothetical protein
LLSGTPERRTYDIPLRASCRLWWLLLITDVGWLVALNVLRFDYMSLGAISTGI